MPRWTPTTSHFAAPKAHSDGTRLINQAVLDHPTFIPRLSWKWGARVPIETVGVAESIAGAGDAVFFCDSSVFNDRLDPAIIEALLAEPDRLVLTPFVIKESMEWLGRRPDHPLTRAILKKEAQVQTRRPPPDGTSGRSAYLYYLWLLLSRRRPFEVAEQRFRADHGREPDGAERRAIHDEVQKEYGPRGFGLASKGFSDVPTDESLPLLATEYALATGRTTHVLTADADVEDQFAKLIWLVNTHYRGMLLADRYAADFARFRPRPVRLPKLFRDNPQAWPFELDHAVLIERGGPPDLSHVLPPRPKCVAIACWRVDALFSAMTFMAEQEMRRVLEVKDRTGGLNTERLGGRNLHPWVAPLPLQGDDRECAIVARDKRAPLPDTRVAIPHHDLAQAVLNIERSTRYEGTRTGRAQIPSPRGTPTMYGDDLIVVRRAGRG